MIFFKKELDLFIVVEIYEQGSIVDEVDYLMDDEYMMNAVM